MVNPATSSVVGKAVQPTVEQGKTGAAKTGESKFDKVRQSLQGEQKADQVKIPPEVKQVSAQQKKTLEADLSRRMKKTGAVSAQELFAKDLKNAKHSVTQLTNRVNALPKTSAFDPLRNRLTSIDKQFQSADQLMSSVKGSTNPEDYLKVQMRMYQLTENLEMMSKVVEQLTSGMKSVLQTQV